MATSILIVAGPTASGKSSRAVTEALARGGEVISVDSRQIYRGLDIGTEKITREEMRGIPHHLIDILDANEKYSAGEFAEDAARLIEDITTRGKLPILAGGTHFYFDALLDPLPHIEMNIPLREELERLGAEDLYARVQEQDARRAADLDPRNRRRLIRALEIIAARGSVPRRVREDLRCPNMGSDVRTSDVRTHEIEWILIEPPLENLRKRIDARLARALERGLIEEVARTRDQVGDLSREQAGQVLRLNEFGLEYKIVGEFLRGERTQASILPTLSAKLWQYARRQRAWLRKLREKYAITAAAESLQGRS